MREKRNTIFITNGVGKNMPEPFSTDNPLNCSRCGIPCIPEEKQEWDKAVKDKKPEFLDTFGQEPKRATLVCRKCIARIGRLKKFSDHLNDEEYFTGGNYKEDWEWHAWLITQDFMDTAILQRDLRQMLEAKLTVEDYNKIIEVLAQMMLTYKYSDDTQELPR